MPMPALCLETRISGIKFLDPNLFVPFPDMLWSYMSGPETRLEHLVGSPKARER